MTAPFKVAFLVMMGKAIGLGHLSRVSVLKNQMNLRNIKTFLLAYQDLIQQDEGSGVDHFFCNYDDLLKMIAITQIDVLVVDMPPTYYDLDFFVKVRGASIKLVLIDDDYVSKNIVDTDITFACSLRFNGTEDEEHVCYGTKYIILRPQFTAYSNKVRTLSEVPNHILISFGGSDPNHISAQILSYLNDSIKQTGRLSIDLIMGRLSDPMPASLVDSCPHHLVLSKNVLNMSQRFLKADLAIISGGMTLYESCCTATPTIIVNQNEEQNEEAQAFHFSRAVLNGGLFRDLTLDYFQQYFQNMISPIRRKLYSVNASQLIDGKGAERIVERVLKLYSC